MERLFCCFIYRVIKRFFKRAVREVRGQIFTTIINYDIKKNG